jgi:hypothetical protein
MLKPLLSTPAAEASVPIEPDTSTHTTISVGVRFEVAGEITFTKYKASPDSSSGSNSDAGIPVTCNWSSGKGLLSSLMAAFTYFGGMKAKKEQNSLVSLCVMSHRLFVIVPKNQGLSENAHKT